MRYLILSDIHANLTALDAALAAAKGHWDKVICLGDVVGYGPDPNEVVERVHENGANTIRDNNNKIIYAIIKIIKYCSRPGSKQPARPPRANHLLRTHASARLLHTPRRSSRRAA